MQQISKTNLPDCILFLKAAEPLDLGREHSKKPVNGTGTARCHGYRTGNQGEGEPAHVTGQRWRPRSKNGCEREYLLANRFRLMEHRAVPRRCEPPSAHFSRCYDG